MVFLCILALLLVVSYLLWRLCRPSRGQQRGWQALWPVTCLIAVVRVGALWLGVPLIGILVGHRGSGTFSNS